MLPPKLSNVSFSLVVICYCSSYFVDACLGHLVVHSMCGCRLKSAGSLPHPNHLLSSPKSGPFKASHQILTSSMVSSTSSASQMSRPASNTADQNCAQRTISGRHGSRGPTKTSHVSIRTGSRPNRTLKLVEAAPEPACPSLHPEVPVHLPSPPSSAKSSTARPNSASRFRKMVLECRDGT